MISKRIFSRCILIGLLPLIVLLLCPAQINAQNDPDNYHLIKPKHSYSVDIGLPGTTSNISFRKLMQGVIQAGASYQFSLKNAFGLGVGYQYNLFIIDKFKTPQIVIGGVHMHTGYGKLAYEQFFNERTGMEYELKTGYTSMTFYSDSLQQRIGSNLKTNSLLIQPAIAFILTASGSTAYKWKLSYTIQNIGFNPTRIGIYNNAGFDQANFEQFIQHISFGFTFTHYFKQRE